MVLIQVLKRNVLVWGYLTAALALTGAVENGVIRKRPAVPYPEQFSSVYALAGEFRVVFANLLWIKAEQYHHEYLLKNKHWTENKDLMALLDIITALDPHFVEAYEVGAYILANAYRDPERTLKYLDRAIAYNPSAWELHNIAAIMQVRFGNPVSALKHAYLASTLCRDPFYRERNLRLIRTIRRIISEQRPAKNTRVRNSP
ncbi:MAG: hypothetical protein QHI38_02435 [Armatimonadota bacterium]|nr:hypothetical protein [Armatimonadota bacterium]